jgi:hypothetical protein
MIHEGEVLIDSDMDVLREEHSLLLVPHGPKVTREALLSVEGCLGVRERSDAMHAVFRFDRDRSLELIDKKFGATGALHRDVPLEEMFIELVGGQP